VEDRQPAPSPQEKEKEESGGHIGWYDGAA
jgi:hypothetical protein